MEGLWHAPSGATFSIDPPRDSARWIITWRQPSGSYTDLVLRSATWWPAGVNTRITTRLMDPRGGSNASDAPVPLDSTLMELVACDERTGSEMVFKRLPDGKYEVVIDGVSVALRQKH